MDGKNIPQPVGLAGIAVKRQPCAEDLFVELLIAKTGVDDGADTLVRTGCMGKTGHDVSPEFGQQMPHGGEEQVVLVMEIVMNQSSGHAGPFSDAQDRGIGEALLMDNSDCSLYQLLAPDRTHSQLRHNPSRKKRRFSLVVRPRKCCGPVLL